MKFYRILAATVCVGIIFAAIYWRLISINFGSGLIEGSIVFFICQSIDRISFSATVFYAVLVIQVFTMRSLWAAVGYFFSPVLAFGVYWLVLWIMRYQPKTESGK
jgi:hypothetical protein